MPTILTHTALPLAVGLGLGAPAICRCLLQAGIIASILPDADVIGFYFKIAYADAFGHRGASHSLVFALALGMLALMCARRLHATRLTAFLFVALSAASHGLLDMLTNGGLGVAFAWPFSAQRFFFPWQVIEASPIGPGIFTARGVAVLQSELLWVWLPALVAGLAIGFARSRRALRRLRP